MKEYMFIAIFSLMVLTLRISPLEAKIKSFSAIDDFPSTEYRVGLFQDIFLDINTKTHVIVIGSTAKEDSDQFFQSGIAQAYRYKEVYPEDQVMIISAPDVLNTTDEDVYNKYNVAVIKKILKQFNATNMLLEINMLRQIASIDFFGHSSTWGLKIGDMHSTFSPYDYEKQLKHLKTKLVANSYVTLNGCNTGFIIAPDLSEILQIPVAGNLTSAMFERIESDGYWYKEEDSHNNQYVTQNKYSYIQTVYCSLGLCTRLKSTRQNYHSIWGNFKEGGLSFSKFFCKFNNFDERCEKGMANSIYTYPSVIPLNRLSNLDEFKTVVFDWLCSTAKDHQYFSKCILGIEQAISRYDLVFQSHPTNELICDFTSCHASVICSKNKNDDPIIGTCHLKTTLNPEPTNIAREYISFIKGFYNLNGPLFAKLFSKTN